MTAMVAMALPVKHPVRVLLASWSHQALVLLASLNHREPVSLNLSLKNLSLKNLNR
jgi:hypothetical protein